MKRLAIVALVLASPALAQPDACERLLPKMTGLEASKLANMHDTPESAAKTWDMVIVLTREDCHRSHALKAWERLSDYAKYFWSYCAGLHNTSLGKDLGLGLLDTKSEAVHHGKVINGRLVGCRSLYTEYVHRGWKESDDHDALTRSILKKAK